MTWPESCFCPGDVRISRYSRPRSPPGSAAGASGERAGEGRAGWSSSGAPCGADAAGSGDLWQPRLWFPPHSLRGLWSGPSGGLLLQAAWRLPILRRAANESTSSLVGRSPLSARTSAPVGALHALPPSLAACLGSRPPQSRPRCRAPGHLRLPVSPGEATRILPAQMRIHHCCPEFWWFPEPQPPLPCPATGWRVHLGCTAGCAPLRHAAGTEHHRHPGAGGGHCPPGEAIAEASWVAGGMG